MGKRFPSEAQNSSGPIPSQPCQFVTEQMSPGGGRRNGVAFGSGPDCPSHVSGDQARSLCPRRPGFSNRRSLG
jgi:hypothetical protein